MSLNTSSKLVLVYYEEEMLDYKTWRNIELFGGHLGHHFQVKIILGSLVVYIGENDWLAKVL